jgi:hypothetical protein
MLAAVWESPYPIESLPPARSPCLITHTAHGLAAAAGNREAWLAAITQPLGPRT